MKKAQIDEINEIFDFYREVIGYMNNVGPDIGWNIDRYPNLSFVTEMVNNGEMFIEKENDTIICCAAINHNVNPEYDDIEWDVKGPKDKISTIHGLAVLPSYRGKNVSDRFLKDIETFCRDNGDLAIHFDVIDTNIPAYKMYTRNGYKDFGSIEMYYEVVGLRRFYMMEKIL